MSAPVLNSVLNVTYTGGSCISSHTGRNRRDTDREDGLHNRMSSNAGQKQLDLKRNCQALLDDYRTVPEKSAGVELDFGINVGTLPPLYFILPYPFPANIAYCQQSDCFL